MTVLGCEGFRVSRGHTRAGDSLSLTGGGGGTHVVIRESNRHMAGRHPLVPHPRCASTTHGVVA